MADNDKLAGAFGWGALWDYLDAMPNGCRCGRSSCKAVLLPVCGVCGGALALVVHRDRPEAAMHCHKCGAGLRLRLHDDGAERAALVTQVEQLVSGLAAESQEA